MVRWPSGSLKTVVSKKVSLLSFSVSRVKWVEGCWKAPLSSSDSMCLFGVELSYGCFDLGDDLTRIEMHQLELLKKKKKNNQPQQSIMLYKIMHGQSTSLPEED